MRRSVVELGAMMILTVSTPLAAWGADELVPGKYAMITQQSEVKVKAEPDAKQKFDLPDGDPRVDGAVLEVFDTGGGAGSDVFQLPAGGWSKIPLGNAMVVHGYSYHGAGTADDPCTLVMVMPRSIKAWCSGGVVTLDPPFTGQVGVILTIGDTRFCASFGGSGLWNDERKTHRRDAPPPAACPASGGGGTTTSTIAGGTTTTTVAGETTTTTIAGETTTTTIAGETTTTTIAGETTTTTIAGETTTTTIVGETTTTTIAGGTTTTTITGETTTTTIGGGGCCNGAGFLNFTTVTSAGDCGDVIDSTGMVVKNINCAGLYTGGGGNTVPLPYAVPDLGSQTSAITSCASNIATLGPASSTATGSLKNCTASGCFFGAPLAVPNPISTPTSVCVINKLSADVSGTADCSGATDSTINAPLSSILFLTGDTSNDSGGTITGIQPCPLCSGGDPMTPNSGTCVGGDNNGMTCTPGTSGSGVLGPPYPTSNDCPPLASANIGTLPVNFALTTGTVTWRGTTATNDTNSTISTQNRIFSGFCRDTNGSLAFEGSTPATAHQCHENGMSVGTACAEPFESCEQKSNGAFGPGGGSNRTITAIGSAASIIGGPAAGSFVSVFTIRPTFDATVDAAGDLPGPGAVALPGTAQTCATANPCP